MKLLGTLLAGLGILALAACGGDGAPPARAPTVAAPELPAVVVTFVSDTLRVEEGETVEITVQYRINSLPAALSLEVSPLNEGADPEDYELSATTFEIPAGQGATGTAAISLTALQDTRIAEGDEAVELRLVPPAGIRAELDGNLEVTIADAGASPCSGVRVVATPVEPVPDSPDYLRTTLELARDAEAGAAWLDWGAPYYNGEYCDDDDCREWWEKSSPILEVNLVEWRMESSTDGTSDLLDIEWHDSNTLRFGFRSADGACEGAPAVVCTDAGCEFDR